MELQHKDIAQKNTEQPHAYDADRHGEFGIAAGAQGVGQRKAAGPEKDAGNVEHAHDHGAEGGGLRREVEPDHEQGDQEEQRGIGSGQTDHGNAHQQKHIPLGLLFLACAQTLADNGDHGKAHRIAGDVCQR